MRLIRALAAALLLAACARMAQPPGSPPRSIPPRLLQRFPDSLVVDADFHRDAEFVFDEVISEGSQANFGYGNGTLEQLVLLSPDTAVPRVEWHRDRISVRPRNGWRPNTLYRIELMPGVADLQPRANLTRSGSVITFTTGGPIATRSLSGRAIDWVGVRGLANALIIAYHLPDSAAYRTIADSTGRFRLGPVPAGAYLVQAVADQDRNHKRNGREPWDTVRVAADRDSVGEIWTFARDSSRPRVQTSSRRDSVSITISFVDPIDPLQRIPADSIRVVALPDSADVGPVEALPQALYDSLHKTIPPALPPRDTAARRDSTRRDTVPTPGRRVTRTTPAPRSQPEDPPREKRPRLGNILVVRTTGTFHDGRKYVAQVRGVRSASGIPGTVVTVIDIPAQARVDSTARARADSAKARADTTRRVRADSARSDTARPRPPRGQ